MRAKRPKVASSKLKSRNSETLSEILADKDSGPKVGSSGSNWFTAWRKDATVEDPWFAAVRAITVKAPSYRCSSEKYT